MAVNLHNIQYNNNSTPYFVFEDHWSQHLSIDFTGFTNHTYMHIIYIVHE